MDYKKILVIYDSASTKSYNGVNNAKNRLFNNLNHDAVKVNRGGKHLISLGAIVFDFFDISKRSWSKMLENNPEPFEKVFHYLDEINEKTLPILSQIVNLSKEKSALGYSSGTDLYQLFKSFHKQIVVWSLTDDNRSLKKETIWNYSFDLEKHFPSEKEGIEKIGKFIDEKIAELNKEIEKEQKFKEALYQKNLD